MPRQESSIQATFDQWMATERPEMDFFERQLFDAVRLLREGQITQGDFFERLMSTGDGKPLLTFVRIDYGDGFLEDYELERTADKKLRITSQGNLSRVTTQVGLNEEGQLIVEKVEGLYLDEETGESHEMTDEMFWDDLINVKPRQQVGEEMLQSLIENLIPFESLDTQ